MWRDFDVTMMLQHVVCDKKMPGNDVTLQNLIVHIVLVVIKVTRLSMVFVLEQGLEEFKEAHTMLQETDLTMP